MALTGFLGRLPYEWSAIHRRHSWPRSSTPRASGPSSSRLATTRLIHSRSQHFSLSGHRDRRGRIERGAPAEDPDAVRDLRAPTYTADSGDESSRVGPEEPPTSDLLAPRPTMAGDGGNAPDVTGWTEHLAESRSPRGRGNGIPTTPSGTRPRAAPPDRERRRGVEIRRRRHYVPRHQSASRARCTRRACTRTGTTALPRRAPDAIVGCEPHARRARLPAERASTAGRTGSRSRISRGPGALQSGVEGGAGSRTLVERAQVGLRRSAAAVGVIAEVSGRTSRAHGSLPSAIHGLPNCTRGRRPDRASKTVARAAPRMGPESEFVCLDAGNMVRSRVSRTSCM